MEQNGDDDEGILGFLEMDIIKCVKQSASTKCFYCAGKSASIKCKFKSCKRSFHLICGMKNGCLFQFIHQYSSYCHQHHGICDTDKSDHDRCMICWDELPEYSPVKSIPSCCKYGWFHVNCIRKASMIAGYLLKCPMCSKRNDKYVKQIRKRGVFVPDQDAEWEQSQNAYASLLFQYNSCDAKVCLCKKGRNFLRKRCRSKWFLLKCIYCGSRGIHFGCSPTDMKVYKCNECTVARSQLLLSQKSHNVELHELPEQSEPFKISDSLPTELVNGNVNKPNQQAEVGNNNNLPMAEGDADMDGLISVAEHSGNNLKRGTILLATEAPPPDILFIEDVQRLSCARLDLWLRLNERN